MEQINKMYGLNLELTTCCPLHCPQCYCTLEGGKHLDLKIAKTKLKEAAEHGVKMVNLSGGETLCYPYLYEIVEYAASLGIQPNVAISGWHFTDEVYDKLVKSGVSGIFISLNGSTEEINSMTRDGYEYAIHALQILKDRGFNNTYINWVMHTYNADDFMNVVKIAEEYNVKYLVVLSFKPDSKHNLNSFPSKDQILKISHEIRNYRGRVQLAVESCFSQLLTVIRDTKLFGNMNVGPARGCRAGLHNYSINIDGLYSPCRHLDYFEDFHSLDEYLEKSEIIKIIRHTEENRRGPCANCKYANNCRPCLAVSSKLHGELYFGHEMCQLWQ